MTCFPPPDNKMEWGEDMLSVFQFILYILLFIGGMTVMRTGLMNISGKLMKEWLLRFTSTPFKGLLFGILITVLLQSSSAVMILTVGFISAGLLTFPQSIGIILGTNIGTTATVEFLAYGTDEMIIPLLILGSIFILIPMTKTRNIGLFFYGLGAIFLAMFGFEHLAAPLADSDVIRPLIANVNNSVLVSAIVGCILTAIIQSSTAMTGIAMGFMNANIVNLPAAIALMLGSNIGTCLDAYIASIGGGREAKLSVYAHIWLNVVGVLLFLPFTETFANYMEYLSLIPEKQLAHASVVFNLVVSLLVLPFAKSFAAFIENLHGNKG